MKKKDWKYRSTTERRFSNALQKAGEYIAKQVQNVSSLQEMIEIFSTIQKKPWFQEFSHVLASQMVKSVAVENARTWREAARQSSKGSQIHQALNADLSKNIRFGELIRRNATFIQSMPSDIARQTSKEAATRAIQGLRGDALMEQIKQKVPDIANYKARMIARTETAKTQAAVTQVRSEDLGIDWYVWRTVQDNRVRSSHEHLEGVVCRYSDPPPPEALVGKEDRQGRYAPGEVFNCRCYAQPLVDPNFISWPRDVYYQGVIQKMTLKQFLKIAK